ncbi:MAG: hypothetical protein FWG74_05380 [Planctomycetes bacterium]|nr:hypothetical protein [Planctomycetota bacterium]
MEQAGVTGAGDADMPNTDAETTGRELLRYAALVWEPGDLVEIRPIPEPGARFWTPASGIGEHLDRMLALNARGIGIYAGVLPRTVTGGGKAEHTDGGRIIWADFDDIAPGDALARLREAGLPPPMLVVSSGHGAHVYWKLDRKLDKAEHTGLMAALKAFLKNRPGLAEHIDAGAFDAPRVLRLPGFTNYKPPPASCRIAHVDEGAITQACAMRFAVCGTNVSEDAVSVPNTASRIPHTGALHPYVAKAVESETAVLAAMPPETGRNNRLNVASYKLGHFVAGGVLPEEVARAELTRAALASGLSSTGAAATIQSGLAAGAKTPKGVPDRDSGPLVSMGGLTAYAQQVAQGQASMPNRIDGPRVEVVEDEPEDAPEATAADPGHLPDEFYRIPGFISDVMDFTLDCAPSPNSILSFCGAVTLQAHLSGRKVRDASDIRPNLYLIALANPSSGKDYPRKFNFRLAREIGLGGTVAQKFASGEGLQDSLIDHPVMFYQTDEIADCFMALAKSKDGRAEALIENLKSIYTSADGVYPARRKAKGSSSAEPQDVIQPSLTILGTAPVEDFFMALTPRILKDGLFARLVIIEAERPVVPHDGRIAEIPGSILAAARWWKELIPPGMEGNLAETGVAFPQQITVAHDPEALRIITAFRDETIARRNEASARNDTVVAAIWGRAREIARKFALLHAVSEKRPPGDISPRAAEWAIRLARHQTERALYMASLHVAENEVHAAKQRIVRLLRDAPGGSMTKNQLTRRTQNMRPRDRDEILADLTTGGEVEYAAETTNGRSRMVFRLRGR